MKTLTDCPDIPLLRCISKGHWTQATVEMFGETDIETHMHFYCDIDTARTIWSEIKHLIPKSIQTVSFRN